MSTANYNFTQQELYTIVETVINSLEQNLTDFANFKARYTAQFITDARASLLSARNLPDEQARNADAEIQRIELSKFNRDCLDAWQKLKRYIADAYPAEFQKPKNEEAGQQYYLKASQENWDATNGLITSGSLFLTNNLTDLTANQNMPATFPSTFDALKTQFETKHQKFLAAEEKATTQTQAKITANNDLYSGLVSVCLDGQEIYKKNEALLKQFTITELLYLASGTGTAGFKGTVTNTTTLQPIEGALLQIEYTDKTYTTETDGKFYFNQLAAKSYSIKVTKDGYQQKTVTQDVSVGTISTLNIQLTPNP